MNTVRRIAVTMTVAAATFLSLQSVHADKDDVLASADADRVSLFQVPLQCPAAPEIACGGASKPILLALESETDISQAWINRAGTVLAVMGTETSTRASRRQAVQSLFEEIEIFGRDEASTEIKGRARRTELRSLMSGEGWYRSTQVDLLSAEEADIIAARLVRRIQGRVALSDEQVNELEQGFGMVFKRRFIPDSDQPALSQGQRNEELLKVAREHLDGPGITAYQEAIARGYLPGPDER